MSMGAKLGAHRRALTMAQRNTLAACLTYGQAAAVRLTQEARRARGWTDRTQQARQGLQGSASTADGRIRVELRQSAPHGVYLETVRFRHKGRLGVLFPTLRRCAPQIVTGWAQATRRRE